MNDNLDLENFFCYIIVFDICKDGIAFCCNSESGDHIEIKILHLEKLKSVNLIDRFDLMINLMHPG
jgi:hypothetical protein